MKRVAPLFVALVLSVLLALVAYRVSVHYATVPTADDQTPPRTAPADRPEPLPMGRTPIGPGPLPPEQARAADAIERARPIQAAVDQFYAREGTWPRNLAQLGLGYPDDHEGGPVAAISVHPFGEVAIAMKPHVARGGVIRLTPTVLPDGNLAWNCRASNYAAATKLPSCR
ncbi:pilin [Arenimonas sp.]|uniref:pilin n=1 Tax=Arenimonas sp. TaxID=1872635 RepID=UPI0035B410F2